MGKCKRSKRMFQILVFPPGWKQLTTWLWLMLQFVDTGSSCDCSTLYLLFREDSCTSRGCIRKQQLQLGWGLSTSSRKMMQSLVTVHGTQVVLVDCGADSQPQGCASVLIGAEVDSAIDAGVGDIVRDLVKPGVLQDDAGHRGI